MNHQDLASQLQDLSITDGLELLTSRFPGGIRFSTAFGLEDQVITHFIASNKLPIEIFTLDTGRLFQQTYDVMELTRAKYNITIAAYYPNQQKLKDMVSTKGPNSFYQSVENRKECCFIRKIEPLKSALSVAKVWITGIRSEQSTNRQQMNLVEWDEQFQIIKYNPLLDWSIVEVDAFLNLNNVPVNVLHAKGYPSIGCAPCTRAILHGEDARAGRWWWESSSKECGLHETKIKVEAKAA